MLDLVSTVADTAAYSRLTASAQVWFAGGERVGYDADIVALTPDLRVAAVMTRGAGLA